MPRFPRLRHYRVAFSGGEPKRDGLCTSAETGEPGWCLFPAWRESLLPIGAEAASAASSGARGRVRGLAREVEAVRHVVRLGVAGVQVRQAEQRLAEFQQAHVRMQHLGEVSALRVRAEHQAADPRPVAELRAVPLRMVAVAFGGFAAAAACLNCAEASLRLPCSALMKSKA